MSNKSHPIHVRIEGRGRECVIKLVIECELFMYYGDSFAVQGSAPNIAVFLGKLYDRLGEKSYVSITKKLSIRGDVGNTTMFFNGAQLLGESFSTRL